jgi:hypothetical protein
MEAQFDWSEKAPNYRPISDHRSAKRHKDIVADSRARPKEW